MYAMRTRNERAYFQQIAAQQSNDGSTVIMIEDEEGA
jgi:hypothetical protein